LKVSTEINGIFNCSLERAFKAPILGDATKFLDGYLLQAPIIGFEEDETWGQINGIRYPVVKGNLLMKKGRIFKDEIIGRIENKSWNWMVYNFSTGSLFFCKKGIGTWQVQKIEKDKIAVKYKYSYYSKNIFLHPINYLFVKIQIRGMMKKALSGIQKQAESDNPFYYELKTFNSEKES